MPMTKAMKRVSGGVGLIALLFCAGVIEKARAEAVRLTSAATGPGGRP